VEFRRSAEGRVERAVDVRASDIATSTFGWAVGALSQLLGVPGVQTVAVSSMGADGQRGSVILVHLHSTVETETIADGSGGFGAGLLSENDEFGSSIAGLGDLDGDGSQDMAVGARGYDGLTSDDGAIWILFLRSGRLDVSRDRVIGW